MVLLMGCFSIYTGLIYNDLFSRALAWFQSGYEWELDSSEKFLVGVKTHTYAFGIDPVR